MLKAFLVTLLFWLALGCLSVYARTEIKCYWSSCTVSAGALSSCAASKDGSTDEMLSAERQHRGSGKMFMRECVLSGEKTEINWPQTGGMFFKGDK